MGPFGSTNVASRVVRPWLDRHNVDERPLSNLYPIEPPTVLFHCDLLVVVVSNSILSQRFLMLYWTQRKKSYMYSRKCVSLGHPKKEVQASQHPSREPLLAESDFCTTERHGAKFKSFMVVQSSRRSAGSTLLSATDEYSKMLKVNDAPSLPVMEYVTCVSLSRMELLALEHAVWEDNMALMLSLIMSTLSDVNRKWKVSKFPPENLTCCAKACCFFGSKGKPCHDTTSLKKSCASLPRVQIKKKKKKNIKTSD